MSVNMTA